jgi:hypothetical protein
MAVQTRDLWDLVRGRPQVDPGELAEAILEQVGQEPLDYRTRLLIRDSVEALRRHWGPERLQAWLAGCPARVRIEMICRERFDRPGFASLSERLMDRTDPELVKQFLRELGSHVSRPVRLCIGGSVALILPGYLARHTEDVDVVDEVPAEIRSQHQLLAQLRKRYALELAHFQSHYLPQGWEHRVHSLEPFGQMQVALVDVHDIFLSKLFGGREKDRDDLRLLAPQLDKDTLTRRLRETTAPLRADAALLRRAEENWYILYGEALPS